MSHHQVVSKEEWLAAGRTLLEKEKAWTRERDRLAEQRRALPWVRVDKEYTFACTTGPVTLAELFADRSQLIVYHFMFGPDWEQGCTGCSLLCDHVDGARQHFEHNDVSFVAVSRAPIDKLEAYRRRMGWAFRWISSEDTDFNFDFGVSFVGASNESYNFKPRASHDAGEAPGASVFVKDDDGTIYHTYSSYGRGGEIVLGVYSWLDMVPKGRNEKKNGNLMDWVKRHDEY